MSKSVKIEVNVDELLAEWIDERLVDELRTHAFAQVEEMVGKQVARAAQKAVHKAIFETAQKVIAEGFPAVEYSDWDHRNYFRAESAGKTTIPQLVSRVVHGEWRDFSSLIRQAVLSEANKSIDLIRQEFRDAIAQTVREEVARKFSDIPKPALPPEGAKETK